MHRHMRQAADRDSVPPGIQGRGRETYRNTRKRRETGREADWRRARLGTRNTGLYRGRPGLAPAPWTRQGRRQDDSKDSALGIQDCAGGQSGTRAGVVKRARQRTGNGAKVRSCRPPLPRGGIRDATARKKDPAGAGSYRGSVEERLDFGDHVVRVGFERE